MKILVTNDFAKKVVAESSDKHYETTITKNNFSLFDALTVLEKLMDGFNNKDFSTLTQHDLALLRIMRFIHPETENRLTKEAGHVS